MHRTKQPEAATVKAEATADTNAGGFAFPGTVDASKHHTRAFLSVVFLLFTTRMRQEEIKQEGNGSLGSRAITPVVREMHPAAGRRRPWLTSWLASSLPRPVVTAD